MADRHFGRDFLLIDGFAACLHDEEAWELDSLGHGVLTFTMRNPGNSHVDSKRSSRAIRTGTDQAYVAIALQAFTPNPVTYLSAGKQNSIDVINGHALQVVGAGEVELSGEATVAQLSAALEWARDADPGARVELN